MKAWQLALLLLMLFALGAGHIREKFIVASNETIPLSNTGGEPWERHGINSTPYLQLQPAFQRGLRHHANAAYFEVDNNTFDIAFQKTFSYQCGKNVKLSQPWEAEVFVGDYTAIPKEVYDEYPKVIEYLAKKIKTSPHLSEKGELQIVHDRWVSYKRSRSDSKMYLMNLEVLLYRTGKFQGKHVILTVLLDLKPNAADKYMVVQSRIEGVVSEDQIGLFPITPRQSNEFVAVPSDPMQNYESLMFSDEEVKKIEAQQREKMNRSMSAQLLII